LSLGQDDVYKVDAKDSFSFFNTEAEHTEQILKFFTDFKLNGRFINVEISENPGGGGGGGYRGKKGKGNRRDKFNDGGGRSNDRGGRSKGRERKGTKAKSGNSGKRRSKQSRSDFF